MEAETLSKYLTSLRDETKYLISKYCKWHQNISVLNNYWYREFASRYFSKAILSTKTHISNEPVWVYRMKPLRLGCSDTDCMCFLAQCCPALTSRSLHTSVHLELSETCRHEVDFHCRICHVGTEDEQSHLCVLHAATSWWQSSSSSSSSGSQGRWNLLLWLASVTTVAACRTSCLQRVYVLENSVPAYTAHCFQTLIFHKVV